MFGSSAFTRKISLLALSVLGAAETYQEQYRDQYHFSPAKNWMNDPNGMVYHKGLYHLYFQYNPGGMTWGNISWGHATSTDLLHWTEQPIALEVRKDEDGNVMEYFYSGSVVVDTDNTSGFGTLGNPALVAIYTSSYAQNMTLQSGKSVINGQESQSIAYSLDEGMTWTTYDAQNPVIHTPPEEYLTTDSLQNFRDPSVFWYAAEKHWVMVVSLANDHTLLIYTSKNLKDWTNVSSFGPANAVSGQWECPGIFPLPLDGHTNDVKWVAQVGSNPGGPNIGSGTQYFVGSFNGTAFTADASSVYAAVGVPAGSSIIEDWEDTSSLGGSNAALNWTASGDFFGITPVTGEDTVSNVLDTYFGADSNTGTITSTTFTINKAFINFRIAGGYFPYNPSTYGTASDTENSFNLKVGGTVVRSATGQNSATLTWQGWDVTNFLHQTAELEIADFNTGTEGWGHLIMGEIVFSESLAQDQQANWVDLGPDYYAAATYNGLPEYGRIAVGWANNWEYGADIPTSPWRSSMSTMRKYSLATIDSKATLVQEPYNLAQIEHTIYAQTWENLPGSRFDLPVTGKAIDVTLTFNVISTGSSTPGDSTIRFLVRSSADGSQATVIGYDASTQQLFVDRRNSGDVSFDSVFPGIYYAPLDPTEGKVTLRVLVDWSLVEVFGGLGESVITAQIFPSDANESMALLYPAGAFKHVSITVKNVASTWK
jgi:beta-fructofuranosidase/levanase